eukprot:6190998-Pleurochrysis_carterae.AAC.2
MPATHLSSTPARKVLTAMCVEGGICRISLATDRMHPIGSYVLRGAVCHECEDHGYMALRAICRT